MSIIYTPKGEAGEYAKNAVNFYTGCSNGCDYCYLSKGRGKAIMGGTTVRFKKTLIDHLTAIQMLNKALLKDLPKYQEEGIFFSFTTDPLIEETYLQTLVAIKVCQTHNVPVTVLTKSAKGFDYLDHYAEKWGWNTNLITIGYTLTGCDDREGKSSPNIDRIGVLESANFAYPTFVSLEPVIDVKKSIEMVEQSYEWVGIYKVGLESGKKYSKDDIEYLYTELSRYAQEGVKIQLKNSVLRALKMKREDLPEYFVK